MNAADNEHPMWPASRELEKRALPVGQIHLRGRREHLRTRNLARLDLVVESASRLRAGFGLVLLERSLRAGRCVCGFMTRILPGMRPFSVSARLSVARRAGPRARAVR